jgi:hypothetical protein
VGELSLNDPPAFTLWHSSSRSSNILRLVGPLGTGMQPGSLDYWNGVHVQDGVVRGLVCMSDVLLLTFCNASLALVFVWSVGYLDGWIDARDRHTASSRHTPKENILK